MQEKKKKKTETEKTVIIFVWIRVRSNCCLQPPNGQLEKIWSYILGGAQSQDK